MFVEVQIYTNKESVAFVDIQHSDRPTVTINTFYITSIGPLATYGFESIHKKYPYRIIRMTSGECFWCVAESANRIEKILLNPDEL